MLLQSLVPCWGTWHGFQRFATRVFEHAPSTVDVGERTVQRRLVGVAHGSMYTCDALAVRTFDRPVQRGKLHA